MALKTSGGNAAFHNFHNDYAHIQDPNERRRLALAEVDKVRYAPSPRHRGQANAKSLLYTPQPAEMLEPTI